MKLNFIDLELNFSHGLLNNEYCFKETDIGNYKIIFSGVIFTENWTSIIDDIINRIDHSDNLVKEIQKSIRGDFVLFLIKKENYIIVITDILGRLPIYFKRSEKRLDFCLDFSVFDLKELSINKFNFIDYLLFGFCLEDNTIFEGVEKLSCDNYLFCNSNKIQIIKLDWPNWWINDFSFPLNKTIGKLKAHEKLIKIYLKNKKSEVLCDLSGGFDSRLIHAMFKNEDYIKFITQKYVQDEYIITKKLTKNLKSGKHIVLATKHEFIEEEFGQILMQTDGFVNLWTSVICFQEQKEYLKHSASNYRVMGFAGEFLRKPIKKSSLFFFNKIILNFSDTKIKKLNLHNNIVKRYKLSREKIFKQKSNKIKWFYLKYYTNMVVHAGEHRSRKDHVTIQPLYIPEIISFYWKQKDKIPSYRIFNKFLKAFNSNLEIPFFDYGITNKFKVFQWDLKEKLNKRFIQVRKILGLYFIIYFKYRFKKKSNLDGLNSEPNKKIKMLFKDGEFSKLFFNKDLKDKLYGINIFLNSINED